MTWTAHDEFRLRQIEDRLVESDPRWARQFVEWRDPVRYRRIRINPWRLVTLVIAGTLGVGLGISNPAVILTAFALLVGAMAAALFTALRRSRRNARCRR